MLTSCARQKVKLNMFFFILQLKYDCLQNACKSICNLGAYDSSMRSSEACVSGVLNCATSEVHATQCLTLSIRFRWLHSGVTNTGAAVTTVSK